MQSAIASPAKEFQPGQYQFDAAFPSEQKITVACGNCNRPHEISNPEFEQEDEKLKRLEVEIFRQAGFAYKIASLAAFVPAVYILINVESLWARIALWLVVCLPLYKLILEGLIMLMGGNHKVGYVECEGCQEKTYVAFNKNGTKLLRKL